MSDEYFGPVLVTGAGGYIGPYVVQALSDAGNDVTAWNRKPYRVKHFNAIIHLAPIPIPDWMRFHPRALLASSGAVIHKLRTYRGTYVDDKRRAEEDMVEAGGQIARIYSVLGPGIPLDAHYAASTFLRQALSGGPVIVNDGAIRSYLHPKDLASALLTILAHGDREPYDVGGAESVWVSALGRRIAQVAGVRCEQRYGVLEDDIYLPDLRRLKALGWRQTISTDDAIADTLASLKTHA